MLNHLKDDGSDFWSYLNQDVDVTELTDDEYNDLIKIVENVRISVS